MADGQCTIRFGGVPVVRPISAEVAGGDPPRSGALGTLGQLLTAKLAAPAQPGDRQSRTGAEAGASNRVVLNGYRAVKVVASSAPVL